ncbi:MAG: hypothetical protein K8U57_25440 [Planctomycetes bacterium]|nr:hypothetical protein [Planctomycetota bacterium]
MVRSAALLLGFVALFGGVRTQAADDEPKDIIAKAIKAHGGEEFLTKHQAGRANNKGKINIPGVGEVEFTQEVAFMIPGRGKEAFEMTISGQKVSVVTLFNGDMVSLEVNGKAMDLDDKIKAAIKDAGYVMKLGRLVPILKEKGYELSLVGEEKVEGEAAIGIRVVSKGHKDINMFFDKKTNLLAKVEYRGVDPSGKEISEERIVAEYGKNKAGITVPKKVIVKHDGKTFLEAEVLDLTFLEKIDDSEFKK